MTNRRGYGIETIVQTYMARPYISRVRKAIKCLGLWCCPLVRGLLGVQSVGVVCIYTKSLHLCEAVELVPLGDVLCCCACCATRECAGALVSECDSQLT